MKGAEKNWLKNCLVNKFVLKKNKCPKTFNKKNVGLKKKSKKKMRFQKNLESKENF